MDLGQEAQRRVRSIDFSSDTALLVSLINIDYLYEESNESCSSSAHSSVFATFCH